MLFRRSCEKRKRDGGFPIVLTASAIEMLEKWEPAFFPFARIADSLPYRMRLRALLSIYAVAKKIGKEVERFHRSLLSLS